MHHAEKFEEIGFAGLRPPVGGSEKRLVDIDQEADLDREYAVDPIPFAEGFATLPATVRMFGKECTPADVLAKAISLGMNPVTGKAQYGGAIPLIANGRRITLWWGEK